MTKESDKTPDEDSEHSEKDSPQAHFNIEDIMKNARYESGMTLDRMEEIEDAEQRGEPLELSDEERADYEEAKARLSEVMDSFRRNMSEPFQAINQRIRDIALGAFQPPKFTVPTVKLPPYAIPRTSVEDLIDMSQLVVRPSEPVFLPYSAPEPAASSEDLEQIAAAAQERHQHQEQIRDNTFNTAAVMKQMLDQMERESKRLKNESEAEAKRWWWVFWVAAVTMVLAGIAAIPIAGPFIAETWRTIFGG